MNHDGLVLGGVMALAVLTILHHCIAIASRLSRKDWNGHWLRYTALAAAYALIAGGSLGAALRWQLGCDMMVAGVALLFLAERRGETAARGSGRI